MAVVTISQQVGSGGTEAGMAVADRLGYSFVDHKRFQEGAHRCGLETDRLWHLQEERPSLFERFDGETRRYLAVIKSVLYEIAEDDCAVVIGRGGQWLLRDVLHVLRARVVAPAGVRATELLKVLSEQGESGSAPTSPRAWWSTTTPTRKYQVGVDARCGIVTLEGPPAALEHAETVIRDLHVPPMPPFVG